MRVQAGAARHVRAFTLTLAACLAVDDPLSAQLFRARPRVDEGVVRGHMEFLASDALNGRASGSRDEWIAATYVAAQLEQFGLEPLGDDAGFVQEVPTPARPARRASSVQAGQPQSSQVPAEIGPGRTWNVVGRIAGRDPRRASEVILLGAHLDHVGPRGTGADVVFNGADDNASGVTAVIELARALGRERPRRSIIVAFFGSEEAGGFGSRHFADHPPVPLTAVVANLQFEMIGRPDPAVPAGTLWLTGFERSTLGPTLAQHGARLVADPHPEQKFFTRSDNIAFAYRGVVAHTVSSYGMHDEYHTPRDELSRIDFRHMTAAIESMIRPIAWLANSSHIPVWRPGLRPER